MNFEKFIEKTTNRKRGFKYHTYRTEYDGNNFKLFHYGTLILEIKNGEVEYWRITSLSDKNAISKSLWVVSIGDEKGKNPTTGIDLYKNKITTTKLKNGEEKRYIYIKKEGKMISWRSYEFLGIEKYELKEVEKKVNKYKYGLICVKDEDGEYYTFKEKTKRRKLKLGVNGQKVLLMTNDFDKIREEDKEESKKGIEQVINELMVEEL